MSERRMVVDNLLIQYEGLFSVKDLWLLIDKWCRERNYDRSEKRNYETVLKDGKQLEIEIEPYKGISDYARININILMHMSGIKEVLVKKDGHNVKLNQGKVRIRLMGYLITDYAGKWEGKPYYYFFRQIFDRFIYKVSVEKYNSMVAEEVSHLYQNIKALLNLYRY